MKHQPVLIRETIDALDVKQGGRYVDGTLGRAGHTKEIIARGGEVLGIDRDAEALEEIGAVKGLCAVKGCHGNLKGIAYEQNWKEVDGVLLDLGVSSPQLDEGRRGFSFLREGPLDMRMDRSCGVTAFDLIQNESMERLAEIFKTGGEEPKARLLARAIVRAREGGARFETTGDLADFIERTVGRSGAHHPATRVFQALRMEVNDEIGELRRALQGGLELLKVGGRFAVITFESITDRIVKQFFAAHVGRRISLQQGGDRWDGELPAARFVFRGSQTASENELQSNPRSRSARLRVIERIQNP